MGVFGLWKVLDECGVSKTIRGQDLRGKKLAFDVSIWIHRNMHTRNRNIPKIKANFLKKILQILSYGILPVMVFDGQVLQIKKRIQLHRRDQKEVYNNQVLKSKRDEILKRARLKMLKSITNPNGQNEVEPDSIEGEFLLESETEYDDEYEEEELSDFIYKIDFESPEFRSLPLQFQHQLLSYMREYLIFNRSSANGYNDQFFDGTNENSLSQDQLGDYSETQLQKSLLKSKIRAKMVAIESQIALDRLNQGNFMLENDRNVTVNSYRVASEDYMHSMIIKLANHTDNQNVEINNEEFKEISDESLSEIIEKEEILSSEADSLKEINGSFDELSPSSHIIKYNVQEFDTDESSDGTFVTVDDEILPTHKPVGQIGNNNIVDNQTNNIESKVYQNIETEHGESAENDDPIPKISKVEDEDIEENQQDPAEIAVETEEKGIDSLSLHKPHIPTKKILEQIDIEQNNLNIHQQRHLKLETKLGLEYTDIKRALKEVIGIFGIPVVESPFEAESQCAALEIVGICDGTVTDDSDSFLFGSKLIIKNFFNFKASIKSFSHKRLQNTFGNSYRQKLILFASLVGSDYFEGVRGVGIKRATEIISSLEPDLTEINVENALKILLQSRILSSNATLLRQIKLNKKEIENKEPWNCYLNPNVKNFSKDEITFQKSFVDFEKFEQYVEDLPMNKNEKLSANLIYKSLSKTKEIPKNLKITDFMKSSV